MTTQKLVTFVAAYLAISMAFAQLEEPKPVNIADFNIEMPGESAVYLINDAHTQVRYDDRIDSWVAATERVYRIKVLSTDGLDLGTVKMLLYQSGNRIDQRQYLDNIEATTYNFNQQTSQIEKSVLSRKDIYRTDLNEEWREVSFALPNVKVNSIIEIRYIKRDPFYSQLDDWYFQKDYPVLRSRYSVAIAAFFQYVFQLQGHLEAKESKMGLSKSVQNFGRYNFQDIEAYWLMEDIPAFREEPFMTTRDDYVSKLVFQLQSVVTPDSESTYLKSWEDVTKDLQDDRRFKLFYTGKKDFTAFHLSTLPDPLDRARKIYTDFKQHFAWDEQYGVYPNVTFRQMMNERSGNTASMGLTLYQILKQADLDVKPVVFSPRSFGQISYNYPFADRFVATIVRLNIEDNTYLLDPVRDLPFGYLSPNFLNGKGLVLGEEVAWEDLNKGAQKNRSCLIKARLAGDSLAVDVRLTLKDYGMVPTETEVQSLFDSDWEVDRAEIVKDEMTQQQVKASIRTKVEDDLILIPLKFDNILFEENQLVASERLFPVDFYFKKRLTYQMTLSLSGEFEIESLPENKLIRTADSKLNASLSVNQAGHEVNITFLFWTRTNSFGTPYYPQLREAFELMAEVEHTVIVVKRKS